MNDEQAELSAQFWQQSSADGGACLGRSGSDRDGISRNYRGGYSAVTVLLADVCNTVEVDTSVVVLEMVKKRAATVWVLVTVNSMMLTTGFGQDHLDDDLNR